MILKHIWERYILREILKVFFLFLTCFFALYAMIDYSLHMQDFIVDTRIQLPHLATYYWFQFIKRADHLLPLSLLVATLKVLFSLNSKGELVALQASGLRLRKILRPFFLVATLCMLFLIASGEYLLPSSLNYLDKFREQYFKNAHHKQRKEPIHVLPLKDRSKIIYQKEDKTAKQYCDVFWVRSSDEIWRMKTLSSDPKLPIGSYVDQLKRNDKGNFEKTASYDTFHFTHFKWQPDPIGKGAVPLENRKISELFHLLNQKKKTSAYEYPQVLTLLLFKCTLPLLSLLIIIATAPLCIHHSRQLPVFFTYAICLFALIAFFAIMDAAAILGENNLTSPYALILLPFGICYFIFGLKYLRI